MSINEYPMIVLQRELFDLAVTTITLVYIKPTLGQQTEMHKFSISMLLTGVSTSNTLMI